MTVSILVTTYNRPIQLRRCLNSILRQTYNDFEIIVIDDCSETDNSFAPGMDDAGRIKYFYNEDNIGSVSGDRAHFVRFLTLAKGELIVYLCDDDYWIYDELLAEQVEYFRQNPLLSMVIGGQVSNNVADDTQMFHEGVYDKELMTSAVFLSKFCRHPLHCNIINGAVLYNKRLFIQSGAMSILGRTKWQSGFELYIAPGIMGSVVYMDKPCVMTDQAASNVSYNKTQLIHYKDSIRSVEAGFRQALKEGKGLHRLALDTFESISEAYLAQAEAILRDGALGLCSKDNIATPVTPGDVKIQKGLFLEEIYG